MSAPCSGIGGDRGVAGRVAVGVDAGGTKVLGLVLDCGTGTVLDREVVETPAGDADAATATIVDVARNLTLRQDGVVALGVGAAGLVDLDGVMRYAPNVAWRDVPLRERVGARVGLPTFVDNDANVAAWGEFRFGAGRGSAHMLMVTVGTGIGGGLVLDGTLYRGSHGLAGEIGHIIVEPDGPLCGCGNRGCWEQVAAGRAIDRLGRAAADRHPDSLMVILAGGRPQEVDGRTVTEAAMRGDGPAVGVLAEVGRRLGEGIAGLVNVLDADLVVIGGGAVAAGDLLLGPARRAFAAALEAPERRPEVPLVPASLGNEAGAVGAADLALLALDREVARAAGP